MVNFSRSSSIEDGQDLISLKMGPAVEQRPLRVSEFSDLLLQNRLLDRAEA